MDLGIELPSVMDRPAPPGPTRPVARESRAGRARAEAPGHIAPRKRAAGGATVAGKPTFLADKAPEVSVGMGAHLGARSARTCSWPLSPARPGAALTWAGTHSCRPPPSGNIPGGQGVAGSNPAVPTGSDTFSNKLLPLSEPTKEPFVCEMALLAARAAHVSRRPTRAFVKPAEPGKPASQGVKDH